MPKRALSIASRIAALAVLVIVLLGTTPFIDYGILGNAGNAVFLQASSVGTTGTSWLDITGLTTPVVSGSTYCFVCQITADVATNGGMFLGVNGPAFTSLDVGVRYNQGSAAEFYRCSVSHAYDTTRDPGQWSGTNTTDEVMDGCITPSANGTWAMRFRSRTNAIQTTIRNGWCSVTKQ